MEQTNKVNKMVCGPGKMLGPKPLMVSGKQLLWVLQAATFDYELMCAAHDHCGPANPCGFSVERLHEIGERFGGSKDALVLPFEAHNVAFCLTGFLYGNPALHSVMVNVESFLYDLARAMRLEADHRRLQGQPPRDGDPDTIRRVLAMMCCNELTEVDFTDVGASKGRNNG